MSHTDHIVHLMARRYPGRSVIRYRLCEPQFGNYGWDADIREPPLRAGETYHDSETTCDACKAANVLGLLALMSTP